MLPTIIIGPYHISTYALVYALAFFVFTSLSIIDARGDQPRERFLRSRIIIIACVFMVGLTLPGWVAGQVESLVSGLPAGPTPARVYNGLVLAVAAGILLRKRDRTYSLLAAFDRFIPYFALAYGIGRLGCLAAGCCGGAVTASPLHMHAPDEYGNWADRYPTQLISSGVQFAMFFCIQWFTRWRKGRQVPSRLGQPGLIFYAYLLVFCLERFTLDFVRADHLPVLGGLSGPQMLVLAGLGAVVLGLARLWRQTALPAR